MGPTTAGSTLIIGPCVIETPEILFECAKEVSQLGRYGELYFKASWDNANRTDVHSYRGCDIDQAVELFREVKHQFGLRILTDVHECLSGRGVGRSR
jgi:2-dehydro-3-deoxyphosphooctonate aldolase (KDO 8-P synthase)